MALVVYDRVQETTATTGTGTLTLGGAVAGYQSFAVVGNGNTTFYCIINGTAWEVGIGTYSTTGPTLARTTVLSNSSGTTSPITLSGASNVFVTYPAGKSINYDANGVATIGTTLGYSDTGIVGSFASTTAGYNQVIVQNKSTATNASSNLNVSNDAATSTSGYAELGINSSTFSGTGSFNIAGSSYLASASTDLTIGTYGAYNLHFVTNSNTTDAMTIYNSGGVSLGGYADPGIGTLYANNVYLGFNPITSAAGTTVLTNASAGYQNVTGTTTQTIQLPVATTLYKGLAFVVANASTGNVTIKDSASTTIDTIITGGTAVLVLTNNGTSAGTWAAYSYIPAAYDFNNTSASFGNATISNAVWNGTTIASGYGGTGLTTFTGANNALYSTSSSALAAGTLPVAAGGTGVATLTGFAYGNGTSAFTAATTAQVLTLIGTLPIANGGTNSTATATAGGAGYGTGTAHAYTAAGTSGQPLISAGAAAPAFGTLALGTANTNVSGALTVTNGGTGAATFTTNGVLYGNTTSAVGVTAAGTTGQILIATTSGAPSWGSVPTTAAVTSLNFGTTGLTPASATTGAITVAGTLAVANGGTGVTTSTGSGNNVLSTSPTLVTPVLGTPASGTLTSCTGLPLTTGVTGTLPIANGGTGSTSAATVAGTGITVSGTFPNQTVNAVGTTLNSQTAGYTLVAGDAGKAISITTGGVTIPNSVLAAGNIVTIYNNSASSQTITQGTGVTLQWAGQATSSTGNRTLGLYGIATVLFITASNAVISGAGLT